MDVLFIGGSGLISTSIARQLIEAGGHTITLYNRGKSEVRLPQGSYEVIHGDRKDYAAFEATFADKHYDVVVDMVAFHPDDTASAIRAFAGRCGQFIHCSTVCVYSGPPITIHTSPKRHQGGQGRVASSLLLLSVMGAPGFAGGLRPPSQTRVLTVVKKNLDKRPRKSGRLSRTGPQHLGCERVYPPEHAAGRGAPRRQVRRAP